MAIDNFYIKINILIFNGKNSHKLILIAIIKYTMGIHFKIVNNNVHYKFYNLLEHSMVLHKMFGKFPFTK